MTSLISSMTSCLVVPFHCGVLDNDRPEQCSCFVYWRTARVPWLSHAIFVSSFLRRTLRKDARRNIDHVRLLAYPWGWARFAVTDLVGRRASGSRVRSLIVLPRGLTRRAGMSCLASVRLI